MRITSTKAGKSLINTSAISPGRVGFEAIANKTWRLEGRYDQIAESAADNFDKGRACFKI
jgi:hypothetical protein